ncbi:MAG: HEAT repeat domain-containing protein [Prolixibacteraceae bacterium]
MTANSKKINPDTVRRLHSQNPGIVTQAIEEIREGGHADYLPVLLELLHSTTNADIKKSIAGLLSELKHRDAIPILVNAIQNQRYTGELPLIVSACWENGLDYCEYLPVFVDLVLGKDFVVAFEAYTVITSMSGKISRSIREKESLKIEEALRNRNDDKQDLLNDLLDFLIELEQGIEPGF